MSQDWMMLFAYGDELLGSYWTSERATDADVKTIRDFLIQLKGKQKMSKEKHEEKTEKINMVFLAGLLKFDPKIFDNVTKALIDTGQKQAVQVGARDDVGKKLARFRQGDFIRTIGIIEPYGIKQENGSWKNGIAIRLTEIKTLAPVHKNGIAIHMTEIKTPVPVHEEEKQVTDDDIPF